MMGHEIDSNTVIPTKIDIAYVIPLWTFTVCFERYTQPWVKYYVGAMDALT